MTKTEEEKITDFAREMRLIQLDMSREFPCYLGSSLSATDILATLYSSVMKLNPNRLKEPGRDILVLSKGHASPALYAALSLLGFLSREDCLRHCTLRSPIYYHPNHKLPGIELSTGSLGQGLNFGIGTALVQKQDCLRSRTFVIVGDGELNEGSNWEAAMAAPAFRLGNLVVVVDRNNLQANNRTEDLIPLENLEDKWKSFGWRVKTVDGHNIHELHRAFQPFKIRHARPLAVIAKTVRNKGISFQENQIDAWNVQLAGKDYESARAEIQSGRKMCAGRKSKSLRGFRE